MQYYQKAAEAIRQGQERPIHVAKNVGLSVGAGGTAAVGTKIAGKLVPAIGALINKYVPDNLMVEGLKKLDPRFGKFISGALAEGYSHDDLRQNIGEHLDREQQNAPNQANIIEQESPELHQFIKERIDKGMSPIEAGAVAQAKGSKFNAVINKLSKAHKAPWSSILESIYGSAQNPQQQEQLQGQEPMESQQQPGQGSQALMAILSKINQQLGQR